MLQHVHQWGKIIMIALAYNAQIYMETEKCEWGITIWAGVIQDTGTIQINYI